MKRKIFMKTAGGGGFPRLARVMTCLMLMLTGLGTGAWATDVYVVGNGTGNWLNGVAWDPGVADNKMTEQNGVYSITFTNVDANSELLFKFAINGSWNENFGCTSWDANELNKTLSNIEAGGANFAFALTEKADVTISFNLSEMTYMISTKGMKVGDAATAGYTVSLKDNVKDADKWTVKVGEGQAQALPIGGLKGDGSETVTLQYNGRLKVKGVKATSDAAAAGPTYNETKSINDGPVTVAAGEHWLITGTGTQTTNTVTIAAGATVTLDGVNISSSSYCIKCAGDATIILKDGSENTLTGTGLDYPALTIGDANTTLTIQGSTGVLNVTSGSFCAGIGGGYSNTNNTCGNIRIEGGVITAQGGTSASGIGSDSGPATCGDIIITGGTITAKGGTSAAGIGTGRCNSDPGVCGDITIANTVTKVTATAGASAPYSIGKGSGSKATCGTVTIGGTKYWENNAAVNGGDTYLATSPLTYDPSN